MKIDLVNPWQRKQAARLIRRYRLARVELPVIAATAHARRLARHAGPDSRLAYGFIAEQLAAFSQATRDARFRECDPSEPLATVVQAGVMFRRDSGHGVYRSRVLRRHRDAGYWETVIVSGGHPALIGSLQIVSGAEIYRARTGRAA